MANTYPEFFHLSDENQEQLKGVVVVAYDVETGAILERATSGQDGTVKFTNVPGNAKVAYRPEITRRAGKLADKPIGGIARLNPAKRKVQENITPEEFEEELVPPEEPPPVEPDQQPFIIKFVDSAPTPCDSRRIIVDTEMYRNPDTIMLSSEVDRSVGWVMSGQRSAAKEWKVIVDHGDLIFAGYVDKAAVPPTLAAVHDVGANVNGPAIEEEFSLVFKSRPLIYFGSITDQWMWWKLWKIRFTGTQPQVSVTGTLHVNGLFVPCPDTVGDFTALADADFNATPIAERTQNIALDQAGAQSPGGGFAAFFSPDPLDTPDSGTFHFNGVDYPVTFASYNVDKFKGIEGVNDGSAEVTWSSSQALAGFSLRFTSCKADDPTQHINIVDADLPNEETRLLLVLITGSDETITLTDWDEVTNPLNETATQTWTVNNKEYIIKHYTKSYNGIGDLDDDTGITQCGELAWTVYNLNPFNDVVFEKKAFNDPASFVDLNFDVEFGLVTVVYRGTTTPVLSDQNSKKKVNRWVISGGTRSPGLGFKIRTYVGRDSGSWKATNVLGAASGFKLLH